MTPCREWRGSTSHGYGNKRDRDLRKTVYVHRWVVAQIDGWDAIEGKVVMHLCDNPLCYRYDHLRIGTHADNVADKVEKGRQNTHRGPMKPIQHGTTAGYAAHRKHDMPACQACKDAVAAYERYRHHA